MKSIKIFVCIANLICSSSLFSQPFQEYVVNLNPNTSVYNCITSGFGPMTVITNTAYDRDQQYIYFQGKNSSMGWNLYCVNTQTGSIVNQFNLFTTGSPFVSHMYYDHVTDTMYALYCTASFPAYYYLAWIDITSGTVHLKDTLSFLSFSDGAESTFDEANNRFIFIGTDTTNTSRLYSINAATGQVIYSPSLGTHLGTWWHLQNITFNNTDNKLYAFVDSATWSNPYLCTLNEITANRNHLVPLSNMGVSSRKTVAIDESASRFIYVGFGGVTDSIFIVDIPTQTVISRQFYPYDPTGSYSSEENVLGFWYDEIAQTVYGIHWGLGPNEPNSIEQELENMVVYPNPSLGRFTISANDEIQILDILNPQGQPIYRSYPFSKQISLDLSTQPKGTYFIRIQIGNKISSSQVVIQ